MNKKTVLITGAAGGIGEATTRLLSQSKKIDRLYLVDVPKSIGNLVALANSLDKLQMFIHGWVYDITNFLEIDKLIRGLPQVPKIDILINVAGILHQKKWLR